jgi:CHAT domain-containing protein
MRDPRSLRVARASAAGLPALFALSTLCLLPAAPATAGEPPARLAAGAPVSCTVAQSASAAFLLAVEAGDYARVVVVQRGADVVATLDAPDGTRLIESDVADVTEGVEPLSFVAASAGDHRVTINARFPEGGPCTIGVEATRRPTTADQARVVAEELLRDGERLRRQGTADALEAAVGKLEQAVASARALEDRELEALGALHLGQAMVRLSRAQEAVASIERSLALWRELHASALEAATLHALGVARYYLNQRPEAEDLLSAALAIERSRGDLRGEATTLATLAAIYGSQGKLRKVIELSEQALARKRELQDERGQALALFNMGLAHYQLGYPQKALDHLTEALSLAERSPDPHDQAPITGVMGEVYSGLGDSREALRLYARSLAVWRSVGNRGGEAGTLHAIANEHLDLGEVEQALAEYEALRELKREIDARDEEVVAIWIAAAYRKLGDGPRAIALLEEALPRIERQSVWRYPEALSALGQLKRQEGDLHGAVRHQEAALSLFRGLSVREGVAGCLQELALMDVGRGDLVRARERLEEALALSQDMRRNVGSADLRASFGASRGRVREAYVDVLVRLHEREPDGGWLARAYAATEGGRAQSLAEMLSVSRAEPAEADAELKERERTLQEQLASLLDRQLRLLTGPHTEAEAAALESDVQAARAEHRAAQARLQAGAAAQLSTALTLDEVQRRILDADTLLLEYALGDDRSFLFAITSTSARVHVLAGRQALDTLVGPFSEALSKAPGHRGRGADAAASSSAGAAVSRVLLGAVADELRGRRVVIVPDGSLQLLPFAALPLPKGGGTMLSRHELVSLPSASLLPILRDQAAQRTPPTRGAAVFADPVFDSTDDRIRGASARLPTTAASGHELSRAVSEGGLTDGIPRLAFTRREARAIGVLARDSRVWLDDEASRTNAGASELASYRYVHFATHGFLNSAHPELSGLVLSLFDRNGRPQDGFLSAADVFALKLSADLVVLSGCRTALGRQLKGEGVMGLARAFMYAGTSRVVASLWKVDDAATAELMKRFYEGMLRDRLRPAAALRRAQRAVSAQPRWAHPYYWAGFQLQGDWN